MADIIDFEDQFKKMLGSSAASEFHYDNELEEILENTPTGEIITDFFEFIEVLKEYALELELRGFEVVAVPGEHNDSFDSLTVGIRQVA
jgi:CRISPR/Cas system CSM-associated protein Csm5 (group 7 of RAMP superfamily)